MRLRIFLAGLALLVLGATTEAMAETRVALVIGNADYAHATRLANPGRDADAIAAALRQVGFAVDERKNVGAQELRAAVLSFSAQAQGADVAVVYYAGHGVQVDGTNYLIPTDAALESSASLGLEAMPADLVLNAVARAHRLRLLILDACRENPFKAQLAALGTRAISRGLAPITAPGLGDTLIAYSAKDGTVAEDGNGGNSPFAAALARRLTEKGTEIDLMFREVRDDVLRDTANGQEPFVYGSRSSSNFYFAPGAAPPITQPADPQAAEIAFWNSVAGSNDAAQLGIYVRKYPDGIYADLARTKIAALKAPPQQVAVIAPQRTAAPQANATAGNCQVASNAPAGCVFRDCPDVCPEMVIIPPGRFLMGSPTTEPGRLDEESPQHSVSIDRALAAGRFDVTRAEFARFVAETNYDAKSDGCLGWTGSTFEKSASYNWRNPGFAQTDRDPVVCVNWNDAQAYVAWLSRKSGHAYRLLSDSEWEYAARAGTTTAYWWGDAASHDYANYGTDDCCNVLASGRDQWMTTSPVSSFPANAFGLYDMHGNVWQWTGDCYNANYNGALSNGGAWTKGDCTQRVLRGGAWFDNPVLLRSAGRDSLSTSGRNSAGGFRVARIL